MKNFIKTCKDTNKLVSVYTNKDNTDKFCVGYVLEQVEEGVLIDSYDTNGIQDCIMLFNLNDVYKIETDNLYLINMSKLIKNFKFSDTKRFVFKRNNEFSLLYDMLNQCLAEKKLISVKSIFDFGVSGFITELNENFIVIRQISNYGEDDGLVCIKLEDIERIDVDGQDEQKLLFLHKK